MASPNQRPHAALLGNLYIFIAILLFSVNIPVVKVLIPRWLDVNGVTIARIVGGGALFWIVSLFMRNDRIDRSDFWRVFVGGGATLFGFIYLLNLSLRYGNPIDIAIIMTLPPMYLIVYEVIFKHRRPSWLEVAGLLIAFVGALIVIVSGHQSEHASDPLLGDILAVICGVGYMLYLVILEQPTHKYRPVSLLRWVFLGGAILCLSIIWTLPEMPLLKTPDPGFMPWFWTIFLMVGPSFLAYLFVNPAIKLIGSEMVSIYQYFMPVATTILAVVMGLAKFEWIQGVAMVVIIGGMFLTNVGTHRTAKKQAQQQPRG